MKLTQRSGYTVRTMADNITRVARSATMEQRAQGLLWYREAYDVADTMARMYNISRESAAGIIAALSPRCRWSVNIARAHRLCSTGDCGGLGRSRDAALLILRGADPYDVMGGPKTRAFCYAIDTAGAAGGIAVIDTWAVRAATRGKYDEVSRGRYTDVAQAYAIAARRLGLTVHQTQAIAWVVERGDNG